VKILKWKAVTHNTRAWQRWKAKPSFVGDVNCEVLRVWSTFIKMSLGTDTLSENTHTHTQISLVLMKRY
jgi:hypothetical protein